MEIMILILYSILISSIALYYMDFMWRNIKTDTIFIKILIVLSTFLIELVFISIGLKMIMGGN